MLRHGTHDDFDHLYPIYMAETVNPYLSFEIMSVEEFRPLFGELLKSGQLYVYEVDGMVAATCIVTRQERRCSHNAQLGTLATNPTMQRKGFGTSFLSQLIKLLQNEGIKRVELCVECDNLAAIHFYEKLGFQIEGTMKKYFKRRDQNHYVDEHIMAILLH
ncbi:unnamed protein product [Didymodactylos carnosus]|uniref:N-acetyltransferase domain-containing protein n=1 Tax=Didymodactylos carnosus TaxID=1234261 RepID=A0A815FD64_9BILA|nr:unnamed protein product [Didymodactylos carnosus]CAF4173978.1 unnamed protein product [Didymodactylos carnosus]